MGNFLQKQGHQLLTNQYYAYFLVIALAFLPFFSWLSLSVIALVTLRKGSNEGFKILVAGVSAAVLAAGLHSLLPYEGVAILATFSLGFGAAVVLRNVPDWKVLVSVVIGIVLLMIALIHMFLPGQITEQFQVMLALFRTVAKGESMVRMLDTQTDANQQLLANYLLGVQVCSIVITALVSLALARQIQSALFYPGGFRKELLAFRATRFGAVMLFVTAYGAWQHYPIAVSCLPILVVYLMSAGMILFFNVISRKRDLLTIALLFVPLVLAPYVMLPVYVLFGSLDSLFNFRLRLPLKVSE